MPHMAVEGEAFGALPDGRPARLYTLENRHLRVRITDFGGRMVSIEAPDRDGMRDHVLLGFESAADFAIAGGSFGALLGRTANRISGGRFTLDGQTWDLSKNEDGSTLHGGAVGFGKVLWTAAHRDDTSLAFDHVSPDGDQGFPGTLSVRATYRLEDDTLRLDLEAETTRPTQVNLSAHPYFNLAGPAAIDMLDHEITLFADAFLPTDARQIPTGERRLVDGTPFDFRRPVSVATRIRQADPQLLIGKGYDHCFILTDDGEGQLRPAARVRHPGSGRVLELLTTQPALQFYTGNNLNGSVAGRDGTYRQSAGFALEAQGFPDAPNRPEFPTAILRPGARYRQTIAYRFTTA
jgi:aldose 1-epimerase